MIYSDSHKRDGFTLIELVVVIGILGLLMAVAVPAYFTIQTWAKDRTCRQTLGAIKGAVTMYKNMVGSFPQTLRDLIEKPSDKLLAAKWPGNLLDDAEDVPHDPWNNEFVYRPTPGQKHPFELYSEGDPEKTDRTPISVWPD